MYTFKENINIDEYNEFLTTLDKVNFMQETSWPKVKDNFKAILCGVYENDKLIAAAQILKREIKFGINLFYIPRGLLCDFKNLELLGFFTKNLKTLAKKHHAYTITIDPFICNDEYLLKDKNQQFVKNFSNDYEIIMENLKKVGYKHTGFHKEMGKTFQPRYHMVAPLINEKGEKLTEEDFLKTLKSKHRYYLGDYHTKRGITFEITNDINKVSKFAEILKYTEKTQGINLRNQEYFEKIIKNFPNRAYMIFGTIDLNIYLNFLVKNDGKEDEISHVKELLKENDILTVSTALLLLPSDNKIKMSEYLYAGNNLEFNKLRVSAGVCLEAIKFSIKNGCDYCNLGGVDGNLNDHLSMFKSQFNALVFEFIGEYDLIVNKFIYKLTKIGYPIIKKLKKK